MLLGHQERIRSEIVNFLAETLDEQEQSRCVITPDGWKLVLSDVDKCQLFDLNNDPGETTNLFYSGKHEKMILDLRGKIYAWQESVGDDVKI